MNVTNETLVAAKARQHGAWSAGDYAVVGTTLQIVGEMLCETLDLQAGSRVLDVCAGNGNATLAAARRFADVTSTDYVPELLQRGRMRAEAEGLRVRFEEADVEQLPYADGSFDVVLSTFGVMFTPDQEKAAEELVRVCEPGGRIGLANWTPGGFIGKLFKTIGTYAKPAAGVKSPMLWGTQERLHDLFGARATSIRAARREFNFRYASPSHFLEVFRTYYGPMHKTFAALDFTAQAALAADILALLGESNRSRNGALVVPGEYLEVVIETKPRLG